MAHFIHIFLICLLLTSCAPSREAADKKLLAACTTAIKTLHDDNEAIEVKDVKYIDDKTYDGGKLRTVKIHAFYSRDRGAISEKDYSCSFEEISSIFGYAPRFYHMEMDGKRYGNFDGTIEGDLTVMMEINRAMVAALH